MRQILLAAAGGALGSAARHAVDLLFVRILGTGFPWTTLTVNVVGGFLMGLVFELATRPLAISADVRVFLATGVLGGFTTFSAFTLDFAQLAERGDTGFAVAYVGASVALAVGALYAGFGTARLLLA